MKTLQKLLLLLSLPIFLVSCSDELDIAPFTEGDPETFFDSPRSFQIGMDGVYSQFFNYYAAQSGAQGIGDILSDNVILAATGRRSNEVYFDFEYQPNNGGSIPLFWSEAYEAINAANQIIAQIDNLAGDARDNILGQALAARAYAHFDLARFYAQIPTQSTEANASLGIIYLKVEDGDYDEGPLAQPTRETVAMNYEEIIGDLETASTLIGNDNGEGRLDRDAVFGILSRVYLYNGDYQLAIDAANEVSTPIATAEELPGVYTDSNNAGIVFELAVNTTSESNFSNVGVIYSQSSLNGAGEITNTISEYAIDFAFFNSISNDDVRRDVLRFVGTNQGNNYNAIRKFLGEAGQVNGLLDIKVLRAAEVLLNKAEAQFELNRPVEARTTLDMLRARRFTSFTGGETGQALEDAIQFNRRVELAFEGHRFLDLKRRGMPVQRSEFGDLIDGSGSPAQTRTLPADNFRFQFPIPLGEINANNNIQQNPGY